jgi:CheY-like chemotaxis protein/chemotaxis signal transduction protein
VGTKFTLHLPLTLLIATALMVRCGEERYGIPLPSVREVTMLTSGSLQQMGDRSMLHIGEEAIEVQPLEQLIYRSGSARVEIGNPVVIVRTGTGPIGLAVDELLGRQEIVIKPIGALKSLERSSFGGATIDPEGRVVLVLDPARLLSGGEKAAAPAVGSNESAIGVSTETPFEEAPAQPAVEQKILLIDDSLSIRKFVGRMLETAGYEVDTAVDGGGAAQSLREKLSADPDGPRNAEAQRLRGHPGLAQQVPDATDADHCDDNARRRQASPDGVECRRQLVHRQAGRRAGVDPRTRTVDRTGVARAERIKGSVAGFGQSDAPSTPLRFE